MKVRRYRHVIAAVFNTVWAILPSKLEEIRAILEMRAQGVRLTSEQIRARIGGVTAPPLTSGGKVAVLNLFGTISQRMNAMSDFSGGTSTEQFGKAFDQVLSDPAVSAIVINVDSPGGAVPGVQELSDKIYSARGRKPIKAVVNPTMASAAYWIGSAADELIAVPSADRIGSIGVLSMHVDDSAAEAEAGLKRTIITSSEFKGELWQPLTDAARQNLQATVNTIHQQFVGAVARNRNTSVATVEATYGRGRTLLAADALAARMVDRIATLDQVLAELGANTTQPSAGGAGIFNSAGASHRPQQEQGSAMNPKILTAMIRLGLVEAGCTQEQYTASLGAYFVAKGQAAPAGDEAILAALTAALTPNAAAATATAVMNPVAGQTAEGMGVRDIVAAIQLTPLSADARLDLQTRLLASAGTLSTAQVLDQINQAVTAVARPSGGSLVNGAAEQDKFHAAARDAILSRTWTDGRPTQIYDYRQREMVAWTPANGGRQDYSLMSLPRLAERCLIQAGIPVQQVSRLAGPDIARIVMGSGLHNFGIFAASDGPAYNVSGMFSNILLDASNVLLRRSYMEANTTFQAWMRRGESLSDFKPVHKVIGGELGDPKAIPEDGEFDETTLTDGKESYKLTVWGQIFSAGWQLIVNDALGSFTEIPVKQGRAMRRKQNKLAYGVIKDNANLADGGALFNSTAVTSAGGHANLSTGVAAPSVAALNGMTAKMMVQTGLNVAERTTLNLMPRYLPHPPALMGTVLELLGSISNPASSNSGVKNIWQNGLTPITEAELSLAAGGSDVAYYLAADHNEVDTLEYAYLQGLETPVIEQEVAFDRLAVRQRIYQAFAVKALDFRGLQMQRGS